MQPSQTFRYDAVFSKKGDMVFISHLDLMTLFRRALRRSGLPFVITGGFTPRVKISMPKALGLGKESEQEDLGLWLTEEFDAGAVKDTLNREFPEGVRISEIRKQGKK
jgi:radical SAM-linked protein